MSNSTWRISNKTWRIAGLTLITLITAGGEFYFKLIAKQEEAAEYFLVLALVALVSVDQIIALFERNPLAEIEGYLEKRSGRDEALSALLEDVEEIIRERKKDVECQLLGDDESAIRYLLTRYREGKVLAIRDTTIRTSSGYNRYTPNTYDNLKAALRKVLEKPDARLYFVIGRRPEPDYLQNLISLASEAGERGFSFHRMVTEMPVMNFLIVEYEDDPSEVLFGWGRYAEGLPEAVFKSSHFKLVKQFSKLFEALTLDGVSDRLSLRELSNFAHPPEGAGRPAEIVELKQWNLELVHDLLESTQDGDEVRVWITFFVDCARTEHILRDLLDRGVKIQVLMMNPNNDGLVRSRFRLRKGYREPGAVRAKNTIRDQLKTIQDIAEETKGRRGSLEVMPCDTMPFGVFYQIANRVMLVGLLLSEEAWEDGPLMRFYPGTQQWDVFMRNWHSCWNRPLEMSLHDADSSLSDIIQPRWSEAQPSFDDQLRTLQPNYDGPDQEDLRIATIAFTGGGAPEDLFLTLVKRGVRIKILLTDPNRTDLLQARNAVRHKYEDGETPEAALDALRQQIARLSRLKETVQGLRARGCRGDLDFRLSTLMPLGFVAHSSKWALLGLFLATGSYGLGPMFIIDVEKNAAVWLALKEDWQARWNEREQKPSKEDGLEA